MEEDNSIKKDRQQINTTRMLQTLPKPQRKRQSMSRRLSGQQSIQQMIKTMNMMGNTSTSLGSKDDNKQISNQSQQIKAPKQQQPMKCFILKNLVNLGENGLRQRYEKDPFVKSGLKYIQRTLMKENQNVGVQEVDGVQRKKKNMSGVCCQMQGKVSYRRFKQLYYTKETEMLGKVVRVLGSNEEQRCQ